MDVLFMYPWTVLLKGKMSSETPWLLKGISVEAYVSEITDWLGKKRFLNQTLKKVLKQDNIHLFVSNYNESLASQSL